MFASLKKIGNTATDTARDARIKLNFAIAMIAAAFFCLYLIYFGNRTSFELILDWLALAGILGSLVVLQLSKRVEVAFGFVGCVALIVLTAALLLSGNRDGDLFFVSTIPVLAVALTGARRSRPWFVASVSAVILVFASELILPEISTSLHSSAVNPAGLLFHSPAKEPFTAQKLIALLTSLTLIYLIVYAAHSALQQANERATDLLLNILPTKIAARLTEETPTDLRNRGSGIADEHNEATILFADIVGFTELASQISSSELIATLDEVFAMFDHLAEMHQVEKIKTIGDAYMAVCGLPEPNPDHAERVANLALDMLDAAKKYSQKSGKDIRLRIGINSGPVIAGIIGRTKFIYDIWGDAVNVASRMESHGQADHIFVGSNTYEVLKKSYEFEALGSIQIKGKGQWPAWRLIKPKPSQS